MVVLLAHEKDRPHLQLERIPVAVDGSRSAVRQFEPEPHPIVRHGPDAREAGRLTYLDIHDSNVVRRPVGMWIRPGPKNDQCEDSRPAGLQSAWMALGRDGSRRAALVSRFPFVMSWWPKGASAWRRSEHPGIKRGRVRRGHLCRSCRGDSAGAPGVLLHAAERPCIRRAGGLGTSADAAAHLPVQRRPYGDH